MVEAKHQRLVGVEGTQLEVAPHGTTARQQRGGSTKGANGGKGGGLNANKTSNGNGQGKQWDWRGGQWDERSGKQDGQRTTRETEMVVSTPRKHQERIVATP